MSDETVLFLCPHAAAKSVLAMAAFQRLNAQVGGTLCAAAAGTEPDTALAPAIVALLAAEGIDVAGHMPRRVTAGDIAAACHVVLLGCPVDELPARPDSYEVWDDLPPASEDPRDAWRIIQQRVRQLVDGSAQLDAGSR